MSRLPIGAELFRKYSIEAPRYTSYPTVNQFQESFDSEQYKRHVALSNSRLLPKDLSIYVHLPFCHNKCTSCARGQTIRQENAASVHAYFENLITEINLQGSLFTGDRQVRKIWIGGGTPASKYFELLAEMLDELARHFHLDRPSKLEIGIRVDPRTISRHDVGKLASLGIEKFHVCGQNRSPAASTGSAGSAADLDMVALVAALRNMQASLAVAVLTDLPPRTSAQLKTLITAIVETGVQRISIYNLSDLPMQLMEPEVLPKSAMSDPKSRLELNLLARETLLAAGYVHLGLDCYVKPGDPLRIAHTDNSLARDVSGYTSTDNCEQIGIGAGAVSLFDTACTQNTTRLEGYAQRISDAQIPTARGLSLNDDDRLRAAVIKKIICSNNVDLSQSIGHYSDLNSRPSLLEYFAGELENLDEFIQEDLVIRTSIGFDITDEGRYFLRQIAAIFDRNLHRYNHRRVVQFPRGE